MITFNNVLLGMFLCIICWIIIDLKKDRAKYDKKIEKLDEQFDKVMKRLSL